MTGLIVDSYAVDYGKTVKVFATDRNGDDVSFTLTKEEYNAARTILTEGIPVKDLRAVITPSDIVGFLYEANPEAQNVMVETEVNRGLRALKNKLLNNPIAVGGGIAAVIMAMVIFYLAVVKDPSAAASVAS
ncbi:MAG: hypothetical protein PWQ63_1673, partial [Methanolobus sp.]|nr:hypothetical protein [Methanolobus sp.]